MSQIQNFTDPCTYLFSEDREIAKANFDRIDYKKAYQVEHNYTYFRVENQSTWHHQSRVLFTKIVYLLTAKLLSDYAWTYAQIGLTYRDHRIVYEQLQEYNQTFPELTLGPDTAMANVVATVESAKPLSLLLPQCRELLLLLDGTGGVTPALAASLVLDGFSKALKAYRTRGGSGTRYKYVPEDEVAAVLARKIRLVQDYLWNEIVGNVPFVTLSPTGECLVDFADWSKKYLETFKFLRQRQTHKLKPFAYEEHATLLSTMFLDPNAYLDHEELAQHKSVGLTSEANYAKLVKHFEKADPLLFSPTTADLYHFQNAKQRAKDENFNSETIYSVSKKIYACLATDGHTLFGVDVPFELTQRFVDIPQHSERDNYLAFAKTRCQGSHVITAHLAPTLASADNPARALAGLSYMAEKELGMDASFTYHGADAKLLQEPVFRKHQDNWLLPAELNYQNQIDFEDNLQTSESLFAYQQLAAFRDAGFHQDHLQQALVQLRCLFHTFGEHYPGITKPNLYSDFEKTILAITLNGEVVYRHRSYTPDFFTKDPDNDKIDLFRGTVIHFDYIADNGWHISCWVGFNMEGMKPKLLHDIAHAQPEVAKKMGAEFMNVIRSECPVMFCPAREYNCIWDAVYLCKRVEGHLFFWHWDDDSKRASTLDSDNVFSWQRNKLDLSQAVRI